MMKRYDPKQLEPKWQQIWLETKLDASEPNSPKPKWYQLEFFPYPSGVTMHVGHVRNYVISDAFARYRRMLGYNVLHPMGWDAFGLPAENQAIKTGMSPQESTAANIKVFKRQLQQMGFSYDWAREINSSEPEYYKWTQWLFLLFYKKGLAYKAEAAVNWCPFDKTVLANEQVIKRDGINICERCENPVEKRQLNQWSFKITAYADRLLEDLNTIDWSENVKAMQRNWIGRSVGAELTFEVVGSDEKITVFTTRPDTLYGATYMVLAPEHPLVDAITNDEHRGQVHSYIKAAQQKSEIERMDTERKKTGAFTGAHVINPATGKEIPVWVADYVLMGYGTGAIMAVPAHDERDNAFAQKFELPIVPVVESDSDDQDQSELYTGEGVLINSGDYDGQTTSAAREAITKQFGQEKVNYKMRDWLLSRQRYWGAPIPIIYCEKCGPVAVPEDQLPVKLPALETYQPSDDGRSPLARVEEFLHTDCPQCGGPAERETDTMDTFVDSSWYFLRFADPQNAEAAFDRDKVKEWLPVDTYVGGVEHAVMHLLFARFWTKVLHDEGLLDFDEPFMRLRNQGMIGGSDGRKMGKRYGNAVTPDQIIDKGYGADSLRLYELFIGPYDQGVDWNPTGIDGTKRFVNRVWALLQDHLEAREAKTATKPTDISVARITHKTIKRVTHDLENFGFNVAIAAMMELVNDLYRLKIEQPLGTDAWHDQLKSLVLMLAPFAPHVTEELWEQLGGKGSVHVAAWPTFDAELVAEAQVTIVVQVNGRVRAQLIVDAAITEEELTEQAKDDATIMRYLAEGTLVKTIYVPGKLLNFVVRP